jgi:hypothetical protein
MILKSVHNLHQIFKDRAVKIQLFIVGLLDF